MFTLLIGSIAIGLAVDDTIHFLHNFRRYYLESGDSAKAIEQTFFTTGKAMVITTIVLSLGFYAYMMANMISVQNFGLLTGSVIILALLADLLLAPATHYSSCKTWLDKIIKGKQMTTKQLLLTLTLGVSLITTNLLADDPKARAIMEKVDAREMMVKHWEQDMLMVLIDKNGK